MVSQILYCKLKENTDSTVTYSFGDVYDNMPGEVVFHFVDDVIEIVKKPIDQAIFSRQLNSLYGMHREEFQKGIFKENIAYEC